MTNYTQVSTGETLARKQVREVLQAHRGTMARMAAQLGVTRTAVWLVLKGKSKSRRILCACVGEAQRLLDDGQRLLNEGREQRACPNCGEIGGEPETIRGAGWSEEVCSKCVGRTTQSRDMQPAPREAAHSECVVVRVDEAAHSECVVRVDGDSAPPGAVDDSCPF